MSLAQITHDKFSRAITDVIRQYKPVTLLDIGCSDGSGSTTVMIEAMSELSHLYGLDITGERYDMFVRNIFHPRVTAYLAASCPEECVMTERQIKYWAQKHKDWDIWKSKTMGLDEVLNWRRQTLEAIRCRDIKEGILHIKQQHGIVDFDFVLIDGGPFTGMAELERVYGAEIIALDDIEDIKNIDTYNYLFSNKDYDLIEVNKQYRNGFAIFKKKES